MAARMERIMGIPQQTKKPSSLKNPRDPPTPRHINKQGAIDIARKLRLSKIGKVGLRITNANSIDAEMMSKYRNEETKREVSQKSLMDRRKGLEMARNIVESRVGKCIMETNDYEMRRFNREFDRLLEDEDQKKRQMTQKKREFVNQKQKVDMAQTLTRSDGHKSPLIPPTSESDLNRLPNIYPTGATQQQIRDTAAAAAEEFKDQFRAVSRGKSPGYMRPLSCNRDRSHDSAVGETERFLSSPYMRAYISTINDEAESNRILEGIKEANEMSPTGSPPMSLTVSAKGERSNPVGGEAAPNLDSATPKNLQNPFQDSQRPVSQGMSLSKLLLTKRLQEIQDTMESSGSSRTQSPTPQKMESGETDDKRVALLERTTSNEEQQIGSTNETDEASKEKKGDDNIEKDNNESSTKSQETSKPPSRGKFLVDILKYEFSPKPESPAILIESFGPEEDGSATPKKMTFSLMAKRLKDRSGEDGRDSPSDWNKKSKMATPNSLTVATQMALLRTRSPSRNKKRRAKKVANMHARELQLSDRSLLMQDPRFTELSNSLIPDSAKAHDLYQSQGKFPVPDHVAGAAKMRVKDSKFRQSRNMENLARFEKLLDSI